MDHFARADDELAVAQRRGTLQRNFQGYSTRGGADLYGFGMSAISRAHDLYWQNTKDLADYYDAVDRGASPVTRGYALTHDDRVRGQLITRLMCDARLDYAALSARLGVDVRDYFRAELAALRPLEADGLVRAGRDGLAVTDVGRLLLRNVAMCFDPRARAAAPRRFSRPV
jgi:oxygen-independent coproporphyrinogen-3 oxidase